MSGEETRADVAVRQVFDILSDYVDRYKNKMEHNTQRHKMDLGYLAFVAGDYHYLLDMAKVLEVSSDITQLTPLPFSPSWLLGLTSSRGEVSQLVVDAKFIQSLQ